MASSGAFPSRLCTIGIGSTVATATTFTAIGEVHDFSGPEFERSMSEVTHLNSDNGFREFIPGWIEPGSVEFTCNYLAGGTPSGSATSDAGQNEMLLTATAVTSVTTSMTMQYHLAPHAWRITWADGIGTNVSTLTFTGWWQGWSWSAPFDDRVTSRGRIKLTGLHTLATVAA